MLAKKLSMSLIIGVVFLFIGQSALANENLTNVKTYTIDEEFDEGVLVDVNHDPPDNNQLQLNNITGTETTYSFVNVPATARGTIVRIDAESGTIIGEYRTAPGDSSDYPSRTSVDSSGNVWVANQGEAYAPDGTVVKIGIVLGGTRQDANGTLNPLGEYVISYDLNRTTCVDRDNDGRIRTSAGLGNILTWPADTGVADDDCILLFQRLPGVGNPQHISVDANDDVWVGGYPGYPGLVGSPGNFFLLDGGSAAVLSEFDAADFGCGGFGGLVDHNGILWSASQFQDSLLRFDPGSPTSDPPIPPSGECIEITYSYGLAEFVDLETNPAGVFIWNSSKWFPNLITKIDATDFGIVVDFQESTDTEDGDPGAPEDRGVAVTNDGDVWVAKAGIDVVRRLDSNGIILSSITVGQDPTGLAVDANGKVWVANRTSSDVMRIDPDAGLGAVDLTVGLGTGAAPNAYSDMISNVTISTGTPGVSPRGTWTVIHDSGAQATEWETIVWNDEYWNVEEKGRVRVPAGAAITVKARVADDEGNLVGGDWENVPEITSGERLSLMTGRYIQIRATLTPNSDGESPILSDLSVTSVPAVEETDTCKIDGDDDVDIYDILHIFFSIGESVEEDDPRDWDGDGTVTIIDARGCVQECTNQYCAAEKKVF